MGRGENRDAGQEAFLAIMAHRCAARGPRAAIPCAMMAGAARIVVGDRARGGGAGKRAGATPDTRHPTPDTLWRNARHFPLVVRL